MKADSTLGYMSKLSLFALPISANMLFNMLSTFIAILMVAKLGKATLAAVALGSPTFITIITVVSTLFYAVSILIGHHRGQAKPTAEIGRLLRNSFNLAALLAIPSSLLLWHMGAVLLWLGQDPSLVAILNSYFHFAALSILPNLISSVIFQFYTGIGNPKFTMMATLVSLPFLILFSYAFILGHFGMPALGLAGVTCAMFIVVSLRSIAILLYMFFNKTLLPYQIFKGSWRPDWQLCRSIIKLGTPIGIQFGGELAAMTCSTYLMGRLGVIGLAASQIVSQFSMLIIMVILGLSQALSVLVSHAYGQKKIETVKRYFNAGLLTLVILFMLVGLAYYTVPTKLISLYVDIHNPANFNLIQLATTLFAIAAISLWLDSIRNMLAGGLRGIQDSKTPMLVGVACLWGISLPACYLLGFTLHFGPIGLQVGFASGFLVASLLLWWRAKKQLGRLAEDLRDEALEIATTASL